MTAISRLKRFKRLCIIIVSDLYWLIIGLIVIIVHFLSQLLQPSFLGFFLTSPWTTSLVSPISMDQNLMPEFLSSTITNLLSSPITNLEILSSPITNLENPPCGFSLPSASSLQRIDQDNYILTVWDGFTNLSLYLQEFWRKTCNMSRTKTCHETNFILECLARFLDSDNVISTLNSVFRYLQNLLICPESQDDL